MEGNPGRRRLLISCEGGDRRPGGAGDEELVLARAGACGG